MTNRKTAADIARQIDSDAITCSDLRDEIEKALDEARESAIREAAEIVERACKECDDGDCYSKAILDLLPKTTEEKK